MTCTCIEMVNEKLASRNTRLAQALMFGASVNPGLMLETEQIERGRGKPKAAAMFLTHCPFCGVKYAAEETTTTGNERIISELMADDPALTIAEAEALIMEAGHG